MRLTALQQIANPTQEQMLLIEAQKNYRLLLDTVGENKQTTVKIVNETSTPGMITTIIEVENIKKVDSTPQGVEQAIQFLYPTGLPTAEQYSQQQQPSKRVLCYLNEDVDIWNSEIQKRNPNQAVIMLSKDVYADVDDDKGILRAVMTTAVSRDFTNSDVPPHELTLKVNDICLITRNLHAYKLPSNSQVRIMKINPQSIQGTSHHPSLLLLLSTHILIISSFCSHDDGRRDSFHRPTTNQVQI